MVNNIVVSLPVNLQVNEVSDDLCRVTASLTAHATERQPGVEVDVRFHRVFQVSERSSRARTAERKGFSVIGAGVVGVVLSAHGVVVSVVVGFRGKSPWISAYEALPAHLRAGVEQRPSSVQEVVFKLAVFRASGREWAGLLDLVSAVCGVMRQGPALFAGQLGYGFDFVHNLPRKPSVMLSFPSHSGGTCTCGIVECAEIEMLSLVTDSRLESSANTHNAGVSAFAVRAHFLLVLPIDGNRNGPKVLEPVIFRLPVDVVDHTLGPLAVTKKPCCSMRLAFPATNAQRHITLTIVGTSNFSSPLPTTATPIEQPSHGVIVDSAVHLFKSELVLHLSRLHGGFRQLALATLDLMEVIQQRLNAFQSGVFAVSICQLPQVVLADRVIGAQPHAYFACDGGPGARAGLFQLALEVVND
jgi:hypothetical protein